MSNEQCTVTEGACSFLNLSFPPSVWILLWRFLIPMFLCIHGNRTRWHFAPFQVQVAVYSVGCGLVRQGMTWAAGCRVMMSSCDIFTSKACFILITRNYPLKTQLARGTCSGRDTALPLFALNQPCPCYLRYQLVSSCRVQRWRLLAPAPALSWILGIILITSPVKHQLCLKDTKSGH